MASDFTDAELQQVAEFVAYRYLEVERGLRDKRSLRRFLSPHAYQQQSDLAASRYGMGGVVRQGDLGRVTFQRPQPGVAYVTLPARQEADRWGALVMELRADKSGRWRVTELTRAQDRNLTRPRWLSDDTPTEDPWVTLAKLTCDLEALRITRAAAAERGHHAQRLLAELAPERPAAELQAGDLINAAGPHGQRWIHVRSAEHDGPAGQVKVQTPDGQTVRLPAERPVPVLAAPAGISLDDALHAVQAAGEELTGAARDTARWQRQLQALEREQVTVEERCRARSRLADQPLDLDIPAYQVRVLGAPPDGGEARHVWDEAAGIIERYRRRWHITAADTALGPQPTGGAQRTARDATIEELRKLTARMNELSAGREEPSSGSRHAQLQPAEPDPFPLAAEQP